MRTAAPDAAWNDATISNLRTLWAEGHSTAEIGRKLGFSKNAIVGKAHRLNLPARPSPIRRGGSPRAPRPRRARGPSLPPLACMQHVATPSRCTAEEPPPVIASRPPTTQLRPARLGTNHCCWPLGEPGTPGFRYCDEPNEEGRPYCPEHCARAYVRKVRRSEAGTSEGASP